jgi:hypothetical protein
VDFDVAGQQIPGGIEDGAAEIRTSAASGDAGGR